MINKRNIVSVRLTDEQYEALTNWKNEVEAEVGIEVPLGALVRRILDTTFARDERLNKNAKHSEFDARDRNMRGREENIRRPNERNEEDRAKQTKEFVESYNKD